MKFSILIPAYKNSFLKEAIDSVLSQSFNDYELIIVNDASPFDIDSIVSQYSDSRIHYYKNSKNCGAKDVVDNWNICLSYASGDYSLCMGDDDCLTTICLEEFDKAINRFPDVAIFHMGTTIIDEKSEKVETLEIRPELESVYSLIPSIQSSGLGSYLYKTSVLRSNGGFYKLPYGWVSDYVTAIIAAKEKGIVNIQAIGFLFRGSSQQISHDMECIEEKIEAILYYKQWLHTFLISLNPKNDVEKQGKKQAMACIDSNASRLINDLLEFDMRKKFWRSFYWFRKRRKFNISFDRWLVCAIKSVLYHYKYK